MRGEHPLEVGPLVGQGRLGQLEVALLHRRAQDDLAADPDRGRLGPGDQRRHLDLQVAGRPAPGRPAASRRAARPAMNARASSGDTGTAPSRILILHFLQVPWPPQVESIAMPFQLAASNSVTPGGTRTRVPLGWNTRSTRVRAGTAAGSSGRPAACPTGCRGRCGLLAAWLRRPVRGDPARAPGVLVGQQVGGLDRPDQLRRAGVHDRAGQPAQRSPSAGTRRRSRRGRACRTRRWRRRASCSGRTRRGPARSSPACEHQRGVGADRHGQRVDHDVLERDAVLRRWPRPRSCGPAPAAAAGRSRSGPRCHRARRRRVVASARRSSGRRTPAVRCRSARRRRPRPRPGVVW